MSIYLRVIIRCDKCGNEFPGEEFLHKRIPKITTSKDMALDAGWVIYTNMHLGEHVVKCPKCIKQNGG